MSRYSFACSVVIFFLLQSMSSAWADNNGVSFQYPTQGLDVHYLDSVNVSWTSQFPKPQLFTFCVNAVSQATITEQVDNVPTNGTKVYIMNFKNVSTCNWDLRPSQNPGNGGNSPNFILNPVQRPTPSTFAIAQVSTLSSTSTTSSPTNTAASTIATPSNEPKPKPKPKTKGNGAIIAGIAALVLILVLGLASLGFWLYRRQKKQKASEAVIPSFRRLPRDNEGNGKLHFNSNASGDVPTIQSADTLEQYRPQTSFRDAHGLGLQASSIQSTPAHFRFGGLPAPQPCVLSKYNADTVRQLNTSPIELPKTPICRPQELSTTTARDRAVELNAGIAAHEIGPSRMENTGFNFPPEKTAVC